MKASASANAIATAIKTVLSTAAPALPIVATADNNAITLTCRWGGTTGNQLDLRPSYRQGETLPSGVSLAPTRCWAMLRCPNKRI